MFENSQIKEQVDYLNNKIKQLIMEKIDKLKEDKIRKEETKQKEDSTINI
jgi:hypothetical protein